MTNMRWILLFFVALLLSGCVAFANYILANQAFSGDVAGTMDVEPPTLFMLRGDIAYAMDRNSYCWTTEDGGLCADVAPPIYSAEMHTQVVGHMLELLFDAPAPDRVSARLHPGSNIWTRIADIMVEAALDDDGRVLVTVPDDLEGDFVLIVTAFWGDRQPPHGDALYTAPVRFG